jgi:hypothetical protein
MRVKNSTQRFEGFVQDLQESFWGDFQGRTREMLKCHYRHSSHNGARFKWHLRFAAVTTRKVATPDNARAFVGTNSQLILTSELLVILPKRPGTGSQ